MAIIRLMDDLPVQPPLVTRKAWTAPDTIVGIFWAGTVLIWLVFMATELLSFSVDESVPGTPSGAGSIYWPTIIEMQTFAGLDPDEADGIWGPVTDHAYRVARHKWYNNECARATWPKGDSDGSKEGHRKIIFVEDTGDIDGEAAGTGMAGR